MTPTLVTKKYNSMKASIKSIVFTVFQGDALVAQSAVFFSAGFETSSAVVAFGLFELCRRVSLNQFELQKKILFISCSVA